MLNRPFWQRLLLTLLLSLFPIFAVAQNGTGVLLDINGTIGPATADYIDRSLQHATEQGAEIIVLRMDTPGGLDTSMRTIVKQILASGIPVVGYVAPGGARAASAGTYILYASHIAAMAPGTNLGSATPVTIGKLNKPVEKPQATEQDQQAQKQLENPGSQKLINDASAYLRSLATLRGRNSEWAERAVTKAESLTAQEALKLGVIDLIAEDMNSLLQQLDGREVTLVQGEKRTLKTQGLVMTLLQPDWLNELLATISNPNIAYILMLVGIYGLIYEFANPGSLLPGISGAIALLLALYAFQVLPINYAGVALILLGLFLMVAEAFVPSFGALGIGGTIAFVFGSLILIDTDLPGFGISMPLVFSVAVSSALLLVIIVRMALQSRKRPVVSGAEELSGANGYVLEDFSEHGQVHVHGEVWQAITDQPLKKDQPVHVVGRQGLVLKVSPLEKEKSS